VELAASEIEEVYPMTHNAVVFEPAASCTIYVRLDRQYLDFIGVWDVALDAAEMAALAKGVPPRSVRALSTVDLK
jgi:hypothetical protein